MFKNTIFRRMTALVLTLALAAAAALPGLAVYPMPIQTASETEAVYLFNADTGKTILNQNADQQQYVASLTKLMTALLLLESGKDLNGEVTVPTALTQEFRDIQNANGTTMGLRIGETVRRIDLLNAMLIVSANDAASVIAYDVGGSVLAHAYLRDDHVLDAVLPPDIPIPSIAEVQRALYDATKEVSGMPGEEVKQRLRTGTVVTTDDRNWELRYSASALRFNLSRAVAIDMESATIAAQGYRFRVPYGTLLCVSDKPLHGEIKLPGQANRFYEGAISEHLQIGIRAIDLLRAEGDKLHSRKLRTFNEPPFR